MRTANHGLYMDTKPVLQPEGFLVDALNINHNKAKGSFNNEEGFTSYITGINISGTITSATTLPAEIIGKSQVDATRVVLFLCDDSLVEEIGILHSNGVYEKILSGYLNFSKDHPIKAKSKIRNGNVIVGWTDDNNPPKVLNLTELPFDVDPLTRIAIDADDMVLLNVWPTTDIDTLITVTQVNDVGGNMLSGMYQFFYYYKTSDGARMGYSLPTEPIMIAEGDTVTNWYSFDGCEPGTVTTKSVELQLTSLDLQYDRVVFCVIQRIEDEVSVYEFGERKITTSASMSHLYTGFETKTPIPIADYYASVAPYNKAATVFVTNDNKFGLAGMEGLVDIDYQKYANNITVEAIDKATYQSVNQLSYGKNSIYLYNNKGFCPNEVYAIYIGFTLDDKTKSYGYHIPGRSVETHAWYGELENILFDDFPAPKLALYPYLDTDRAISPGKVRVFHTRDTSYYSTTGMGYWENQNEFYPDTDDFDIYDSTETMIGTLRPIAGVGQKVRHHKMPAIATHGGSVTSSSWYDPGASQTHIYGIKLSNVYIPAALIGRIVSINVYYAKRSAYNATILDQGILFHNEPTDEEFSMMPFASLKNNITPLATFITNDIILRGVKVNDTTPTYTNFYKQNFLEPVGCTTSATSASKYIRKIINLRYVTDSLLGTAIYGKRLNGTIDRQPSDIDLTGPATNDYHLSSLCVFREDMYIDWTKQELVCIPSAVPVTGGSSGDIYHGDTFNCDYGFRIIWNHTGGVVTDVNDPAVVYRALFWHPCVSSMNINMRYDSITDLTGDNHYYPKDYGAAGVSYANSGLSFLRRDITSVVNTFYYDDTFSGVNDKHAVVPFVWDSVSITNLGNRILLSEQSNEEETTESWKNFLANNYFDLPSKGGHIVNVEQFGDEIIINTNRELYRTIGNKAMKVDNVTVYIGSGDIFSLQPQEQTIGDDGYAGCTSRWSCILVPTGYVYCNQDLGKVFIYNGKLNEMSALGGSEWFRNNLPSILKKKVQELAPYNTFDFDNPLTVGGILTEYDAQYNRLILTKRDYDFQEEVSVGGVTIPLVVQYTNDSRVFTGSTNKLWILQGSDDSIQFIWDAEGDFDEIFAPDSKFFSDISWTITFSFDDNEWKSFMTYAPVMMLKNDTHLLSQEKDSSDVFRHNIAGTYGIFYDSTVHESFIEIVLNTEQDYTSGKVLSVFTNKLFDSLYWMSDFIDGNGVNRYDKTITSILIYNENQCSGAISLSTTNLFNEEGTWNFNDFRDIVINYLSAFVESSKGIETSDKVISANIDNTKRWYNRYYFHGEYIVVRLIYDNVDQYEMNIHGYGGYVQQGNR